MTTQTPITDAIACANCNGELAKALLREMTPEALAHRLQHELARNAALIAALAEVLEQVEDTGFVNQATGTKARATLAKVRE